MKDDNSRDENGNDIRLSILGLSALFSKFRITTSSGKHLKDISYSHILPLMHKSIASAKSSDNWSIGFDRSRDRRQQELTNNENIEGKLQVRVMLMDTFALQEHQEKATYGLGYKLTLTKKS